MAISSLNYIELVCPNNQNNHKKYDDGNYLTAERKKNVIKVFGDFGGLSVDLAFKRTIEKFGFSMDAVPENFVRSKEFIREYRTNTNLLHVDEKRLHKDVNKTLEDSIQEP